MRVALVAALWLLACGAELPPDPTADPLMPSAPATTPAAEADEPAAGSAWVIDSFGFLYAEPDGRVDALDIDGVLTGEGDPPPPEGCVHTDLDDGADHQLLRLVQSFESLYPEGIADQIIGSAARNGSMTVLLTMDPQAAGVVVGEDPPLTGNDGEVLWDTTFRPRTEPRYVGSLDAPTLAGQTWTAGPGDVAFRMNIQIVKADLALKDAWIRMTVDDSGAVHGVIQGYWHRDSVVEILASTPAHLAALGYSLEEFEAVLDAYADRSPNAAGVCQELSAAFRFTAVPAYLLEAP